MSVSAADQPSGKRGGAADGTPLVAQYARLHNGINVYVHDLCRLCKRNCINASLDSIIIIFTKTRFSYIRTLLCLCIHAERQLLCSVLCGRSGVVVHWKNVCMHFLSDSTRTVRCVD